jgi:hypothetical protein
MVEISRSPRAAATAGAVLGRKLDSIPFSAYHPITTL